MHRTKSLSSNPVTVLSASLLLPDEGILVELKQIPFVAHDVFTYTG